MRASVFCPTPEHILKLKKKKKKNLRENWFLNLFILNQQEPLGLSL